MIVNPSFRAFTATFSEIVRRPLIEVMVCDASEKDPDDIDPSEFVTVSAIMDTGATFSVVSDELASRLSLVSSGERQVGHAGGKSVHHRYYVHFVLPQGISMPRVRVAGMPISGCDVLIGMDIISKGDFAVTNCQAQTVISFRTPSTGQIDFARETEPR